ncbi:hypothetical protein MUK42_27740 [Musa troglodytarum]|uniref:Uncharacterized protein n=1 Tax=Musa troglodytarum TaxID=320322 RepID=A0A9E7KDT9_9LILI|nr:hypothetical protein MUK42_27740 [Musa troglodytarum]
MGTWGPPLAIDGAPVLTVRGQPSSPPLKGGQGGGPGKTGTKGATFSSLSQFSSSLLSFRFGTIGSAAFVSFTLVISNQNSRIGVR